MPIFVHQLEYKSHHCLNSNLNFKLKRKSKTEKIKEKEKRMGRNPQFAPLPTSPALAQRHFGAQPNNASHLRPDPMSGSTSRVPRTAGMPLTSGPTLITSPHDLHDSAGRGQPHASAVPFASPLLPLSGGPVWSVIFPNDFTEPGGGMP
jgi:hypothetical protein